MARELTTEQLDAICNSKSYETLCIRLHHKYPYDPDTDDYPSAYWDEFELGFKEIIQFMFPCGS